MSYILVPQACMRQLSFIMWRYAYMTWPTQRFADSINKYGYTEQVSYIMPNNMLIKTAILFHYVINQFHSYPVA